MTATVELMEAQDTVELDADLGGMRFASASSLSGYVMIDDSIRETAGMTPLGVRLRAPELSPGDVLRAGPAIKSTSSGNHMHYCPAPPGPTSEWYNSCID